MFTMMVRGKKVKIENDDRVFITRDTDNDSVEVYPAVIGIRKFHGCLQYGAACNITAADSSWPGGYIVYLDEEECIEKYDFFPKEEEAWYIPEQGTPVLVDIEFSG